MFWLNSCYHIIASLILILPPILPTQRKQFTKHSQSRLLQFPCIHHLSSTFHEVYHQHFFRVILGRIPMIRFNEAPDPIVSRQPSFVLCHITSTLAKTYSCKTAIRQKGISWTPDFISQYSESRSTHFGCIQDLQSLPWSLPGSNVACCRC